MSYIYTFYLYYTKNFKLEGEWPIFDMVCVYYTAARLITLKQNTFDKQPRGIKIVSLFKHKGNYLLILSTTAYLKRVSPDYIEIMLVSGYSIFHLRDKIAVKNIKHVN